MLCRFRNEGMARDVMVRGASANPALSGACPETERTISTMQPLTAVAIGTTVHDFIRENFLFDREVTIDRDRSLLSTGIIDSTGILELIGFLETTYGIRFQDRELVAENFDSISRIQAFVARKLDGEKGD